ncbi:hypothetical protein HF325_000095 [Metschnikowia pulcherrima]|uniref:Uncharacterized protein n=1 Tax=Metschnikowia pulcherrima TaxID=27326 RepID=A0A8H7GWA6_9ASCO|nr:hypothetical protein HF325_000095 [Metschnikowia pulcherrima]
MIYRPLAYAALAALATAASQFSEKRSITVKHYENLHIVNRWEDNRLLAISKEPFLVVKGSEDVVVEVPRVETVHVWELTGFYDAKEAGEFTFALSGSTIASIQVGYDSKEAENVDEWALKPAFDITTTPIAFNLKKGPNPIRVLYLSSEDITDINKLPIHVVDGVNGDRNINADISQAHDDSGDATEPVYRATGFLYRVFEEPHVDVDSIGDLQNQYSKMKKIQEGYLDASYTGVIIPGSIPSKAVEIMGFMRVPENGTYVVLAETDLLTALQVGVGPTEKQARYKVNTSWRFLDTRKNRDARTTPSVKLNLLKEGYYPFRLVIVGNENDLKLAISQFGPKNLPMDFLGIWDIVPQSAGANPQIEDDDADDDEGDGEEEKKAVIPLIHQADPSQSAAAARPQDQPASDGHADSDRVPSLDHLPASLSLPTDVVGYSSTELALDGGQTAGKEEEKAREPLDGAKNGGVSKQPASAGEGASAAKKPKVQGGSDGSAQAESGPGLAEPMDELYGLNFLDRVKSEYRRLSLGNPRNVKSGVNSEDPQKNQSDECKNTGNACLPEPAGGYQGNVDETATENPVEDLKDIETPKRLNDNRVPADKKEEEKAPGGLVETTSGPSDSGSTQTQALGQNLPLETLAPGINSVCHW